jgi:isocitrate lyase
MAEVNVVGTILVSTVNLETVKKFQQQINELFPDLLCQYHTSIHCEFQFNGYQQMNRHTDVPMLIALLEQFSPHVAISDFVSINIGADNICMEDEKMEVYIGKPQYKADVINNYALQKIQVCLGDLTKKGKMKLLQIIANDLASIISD